VKKLGLPGAIQDRAQAVMRPRRLLQNQFLSGRHPSGARQLGAPSRHAAAMSFCGIGPEGDH
jgi:hypothetical protein